MTWFITVFSVGSVREPLIAVVAHDAGGAEVLSSYVLRNQPKCIYVLEGPARKIFEKKLGLTKQTSIEEALKICDLVLTGSSWQSDLELRAIEIAKAIGKPSNTFLDHWGQYRERFVRAGKIRLPDAIWVGDNIALQRAKISFAGHEVRLVPNPYFLDIQDAINRLQEGKNKCQMEKFGTILYVSEPTSEHAYEAYGSKYHWGYTEYDALRYFLEHVEFISRNKPQIVIRPHPSEVPEKYAEIVRTYGAGVRLGGNRQLLEEIADSEVVVGSCSMAMVIALMAGRRVISAIPPGGKSCSLPHAEIESLMNIIDASKNQ